MTTLTALTVGTAPPDFYHALVGGVNKKYTGPKVVNVKDHGATGDGETDDRAAIQAAIDEAFGGPFDSSAGTGGNAGNPFVNTELYFPPGRYVVAAPLVVMNSVGARIYGAGVGVTELVLTATGSEFIDTDDGVYEITPLWFVDGLLNCEMSNMTWTSSATPYLIKAATASVVTGTDVVTVADTSDIVVGMAVWNKTRPNFTLDGDRVTEIINSTTVRIGTDNGAVDTQSGDVLVFISTTHGCFAYQRVGATVSTGNLVFRNLEINNFAGGILGFGAIARSDNGVLENVVFNDCAWFGLRVVTFNTVNWGVFGGGAHNCALATTLQTYAGANLPANGNVGAAYCIAAGSIPLIVGIHTSGNGWVLYSASTQGQVIIGARMEDRQCIATAGATVFLSGCEFTGGDDTNGVRYVSTAASGYVTFRQCLFAPSTTIAASPNYIVEMGNNPELAVFQECKFEGFADELGIKGSHSTNNRVSFINCDGASMPSATTLFANYTAIVDDYQPQIHGCEVADLPAAHAKFKGLRGWVTDANATTYMSTVANGGSNVVKVFCNGTNWVIG